MAADPRMHGWAGDSRAWQTLAGRLPNGAGWAWGSGERGYGPLTHGS